MSAAGGVGINLAIQDAVAAATLLAEPLRLGRLTTADLAKVQWRRWRPMVILQRGQMMLHDGFFTPVLTGRRVGPPTSKVLATRYVPGSANSPPAWSRWARAQSAPRPSPGAPRRSRQRRRPRARQRQAGPSPRRRAPTPGRVRLDPWNSRYR
ncbi:hypothetical protein ACIQ9Q_41885 [Streptomyces sp. NPDC094438]|uniref:hypothetical protein n=1 Tax=Streptomyces sp. NPDC094438 TaxID=3366061 RepID=UPI00382594B6